MKNNNLAITIGATTLITLGALGLALTGDKKDADLKLEDSIYYDSGFAIRNTYQEIVWQATDKVEYQNVIDTAKRKAEERELERQRLLEEQRKQEELKRKKEEEAKNNLGKFNVSFFTAQCYKCSGITKSGIDVRENTKYQGYGIVASDWSVLPAYSIIEIEGLGHYIVLDTGGKIKNKSLDVLVKTKEEAIKLGRQYLNVKVIRWGDGK